ncbi:MAG: hypothetical protein JNM18_07885 [Planctomycetaceae bacterium]|nr:hypothetical protein [Planctomycetaceae bacterium]
MRLATLVRIGVVLVLLIVLLIFATYRAAVHEPEFYRAETAVPAAEQKVANDEFLAQTTAVASVVEQPGAWSLRLTQEQINGFLAVDLPQNHGNVLPPFLKEPRVQLQAHEATIACRLQEGALSSVATLAIDVTLAEPNVIAVRFKRLRAGIIPMPLEKLLEQLRNLAEQNQVPIRWTREDGDTVALVTLPPLKPQQGVQQRVQQIEIREGEVFIAGSSSPMGG